MARVLFFAQARDATGCKEVAVQAATVGEALDEACARFPRLAEVLNSSAVWRNGEPAGGAEPVGDADEVAVLPPVSGG